LLINEETILIIYKDLSYGKQLS